MSNLFASLRSSADTLLVLQRALTVTQNNVSNASTPGYARQIQELEALRFDPDAGITGGVKAAQVTSTRNSFAERAVQQSVQQLGRWDQMVSSLEELDNGFDVSGETGIPGALSQLFKSFSTWSVSPSSASARQDVLSGAESLVQAFHQADNLLASSSADTDQQISDVVTEVNRLAGELRDLNTQRSGISVDAGIDAQVHNTLEELSQLVDVTTVKQSDGSVMVLLGGQTPLVVGEFQYTIGADSRMPTDPAPTYPSAPVNAVILNSEGIDITAQVSGGKLGGLLDYRNRVLGSVRGDAYRQGDLNRLAQGIADRVNTILTSGNISDGPPAVPGVPLFTYGSADGTGAAGTLSVNPDITVNQLAAIAPGPPYSTNGTALALAGLAVPTDPADKLDKLSFTQFYGSMASRIGSQLSTARNSQTLHQNLVNQARSQREDISGVSLDEEAIRVLEFQRSYQAAAKMVAVLDELTQTMVNLIR